MNTPQTTLTLPDDPQVRRGTDGGPAGVLSAHRHEYRRVYLCECGEEKPLRVGRPPTVIRHTAWKTEYEAGTDIAIIARAAGVRYWTVRKAIERLGAVVPDRRANRSWSKGSANPERDETIRRLAVDEHLSFTEIGLRLGITRERVRQVLRRRFGIDLHAVVLASNAARRAKRAPIIITCQYCGTDYLKGTYPAHRRAAGAGHRQPPEAMTRGVRIVADYQAGMLLREIMAKYGVAAARVTRDLRYAGVPLRRPGNRLPSRARSAARKDAIASAIVAGKRRMEIARTFGVSDAWVAYVARERGLRIIGARS